jgi:putative nucleotidyltransferase with HDIG domain
MEFNVHNLVKWFQINYPSIVKAMKNSNHHYSEKELNPWHLESDVFTHTMMVMLEASRNELKLGQHEYNQLLVAALLHDLGKPMARRENHEKKRVNFYSHEPLSAFLAIPVIDHIAKDFGVELEKREIIEAIAMHTEVYKLTEEKLTDRLVNRQSLANLLMGLSLADHGGRFYEMGDRINDKLTVKHKPMGQFNKQVVVNIGLPCSGKSTGVKGGSGWRILSRDEIVMELGRSQGIDSYNDAFNSVDQKEVDKILQERKKRYIKEGNNVVIDMTHMSRKSRRKSLQGFGNDYMKTAIVHMTSLENIEHRNKNRKGKTIPDHVFEKMAMAFYPPLYDEFDEIIWEFN